VPARINSRSITPSFLHLLGIKIYYYIFPQLIFLSWQFEWFTCLHSVDSLSGRGSERWVVSVTHDCWCCEGSRAPGCTNIAARTRADVRKPSHELTTSQLLGRQKSTSSLDDAPGAHSPDLRRDRGRAEPGTFVAAVPNLHDEMAKSSCSGLSLQIAGPASLVNWSPFLRIPSFDLHRGLHRVGDGDVSRNIRTRTLKPTQARQDVRQLHILNTGLREFKTFD
jgi:hypothetical protein